MPFDQIVDLYDPLLKPASGVIGERGNLQPLHGTFVGPRLSGFHYPAAHALGDLDHPVGMAGMRGLGKPHEDGVGRAARYVFKIDRADRLLDHPLSQINLGAVESVFRCCQARQEMGAQFTPLRSRQGCRRLEIIQRKALLEGRPRRDKSKGMSSRQAGRVTQPARKNVSSESVLVII